MRSTRILLFTPWLCLAAGSDASRPDFFESRIRPLLIDQCYACHAASRLGGLRLDSREAFLKGGASGPAVVPGDPDKSLLVIAVRQSRDDLKMPKGGKLKPGQIESLVAWVKAGAVWPEAAISPPLSGAYAIRPEQRAFWSFQPLRKSSVPSTSDAAWPTTDIDRFILEDDICGGLPGKASGLPIPLVAILCGVLPQRTSGSISDF